MAGKIQIISQTGTKIGDVQVTFTVGRIVPSKPVKATEQTQEKEVAKAKGGSNAGQS